LFGRGERAHISVKKNVGGEHDYIFSFTKPLLFLQDGKENIKVELSKNTYDKKYYSSIDETETTAAVSITDGAHTFGYSLAYRNIIPTRKATESVLWESGPHFKSAFFHSWSLDTRDSAVLPTQGSKAKFATELAGFGGDVNHIRYSSTLQTHIPISSIFILSLALRFGHLQPLEGTRTSISDRFFLGGIDGFRGFEPKGFCPRSVPAHQRSRTSRSSDRSSYGDSLGGDSYYAASATLQYPIRTLPVGILAAQCYGSFGNCIGTVREGRVLHNLFKQEDTRVMMGIGLVLVHQMGLRLEVNYNFPVRRLETDVIKTLEFGITADF